MLNVALVAPSQGSRYPQPPMGLAILAAVLERAGYPVTVVDANALGLDAEQAAREARNADVVLLTAMTPTINAAGDIAKRLKQANPRLPVVLGGAHATLLPEETLASLPDIDLIVRGEGEESVLEVLQGLERGQIEGIEGTTCRKDGAISGMPARPGTVDLDGLPFLAYHLLPLQRYRPHPPHGRALPFAAIITSRGCPYRCAYCSKPVFGSKFRAQSPERVVEEIEYYIKRFGTREIAFYDDVFTLDKRRAFAISELMLQKGIKLHWTCETRVNLVDRELLTQMKRAGCYAVSYGVESASPDILKTINKDISADQVEEAVRMTRECGVQAIGYFMIGSPGETPATIRQTIDLAKGLKLDFAQFAITVPFPATKLYQLYKEMGGAEVAWENFVYEGGGDHTPVFESAELSRAELHDWAKRAYREFYLRPSYVWQRLCQVRSAGDVRVNLQGLLMLLRSVGARKGS